MQGAPLSLLVLVVGYAEEMGGLGPAVLPFQGMPDVQPMREPISHTTY